MKATLAWIFALITLGKPDVATSAWAQRSIVAFDSILFDFDRGTLRMLGSVFPIGDCSDASYYCMDNAYISFSLPKKCSDFTKINDSASNSVKKIGEITYFDEHDPKPVAVFLLQNPNNSAVVLEYELDKGVVGISYDAASIFANGKGADIAKSIADGSYTQLRGKKWRYAGRMTTDAFAACQSSHAN